MRKNTYLLAKIGADTAENEQHFAKFLPSTDQRRQRPWSQVPGRKPIAVYHLRGLQEAPIFQIFLEARARRIKTDLACNLTVGGRLTKHFLELSADSDRFSPRILQTSRDFDDNYVKITIFKRKLFPKTAEKPSTRSPSILLQVIVVMHTATERASQVSTL